VTISTFRFEVSSTSTISNPKQSSGCRGIGCLWEYRFGNSGAPLDKALLLCKGRCAILGGNGGGNG